MNRERWQYGLSLTGLVVAVCALGVADASPLARLTLVAAGLTMMILGVTMPGSDG